MRSRSRMMLQSLLGAFIFSVVCVPVIAMRGRGTQTEVIELPDLLTTGKGFSFRVGKVMQTRKDVEDYDLIIDLVWDPPTGLMANNAESFRPFSGKGGILDAGKKKLSEVKEAPKAGYLAIIPPKDIHAGHTYCVLTADGKHYGKIHIIQHDPKEKQLRFTWCYQPKSTNVFDEAKGD